MLAGGAAQRLGARTPTGEEALFYATGMSLVVHPRSPMVPTVHLNVRYFDLTDAGRGARWTSGSAAEPISRRPIRSRRTRRTSTARSRPCATGTMPAFYPRFKSWCDHYFVNTHRGDERRGIGGIFFDNLRDGDGGLVARPARRVRARRRAASLPTAYEPIVERRRALPYGERERRFQLARRGRYVEFNLVHDRGTIFGLQTNARIESVLMSLPPLAAWEYAPEYEPGSFEAELLAMLEPRDWAAEG